MQFPLLPLLFAEPSDLLRAFHLQLHDSVYAGY